MTTTRQQQRAAATEKQHGGAERPPWVDKFVFTDWHDPRAAVVIPARYHEPRPGEPTPDEERWIAVLYAARQRWKRSRAEWLRVNGTLTEREQALVLLRNPSMARTSTTEGAPRGD